MPVGSIIELYTTLLGWLMYDGLWDLMGGTGLLMVPFIVAIVQTIMDDNILKTDVSGFVNALENRLYLMIFMMFFAAAPTINLHTSKMLYTQVSCEVDAEALKKKTNDLYFEDTESNMDNSSQRFMASVSGSVPQMPMWWYFWGRLSIAFSTTLKTILPCAPNFVTMNEGMGSLVITDTDLKTEVAQFHKDCWQRGVTMYWRDVRNGSLPKKSINDQDISWIGSSVLRTNPNYYPALRAEQPVKYWPYRESVDSNMTSKEDAGGNGFPYCNEWWQAPDSSYGYEGLRDRLYQHITKKENYSTIKSWWDYYWGKSTVLGDSDKTDFIVRTAISNTETQLKLQVNRSTDAGFLDKINNLVSSGGLLFKSIGNRAEANVYRAAGPIVQSLLIMLFIMFLPILQAVALFDIGKTLTLSMIYFSLIFWGYLFELADYINNFLLSALISGNKTGLDNLNALELAQTFTNPAYYATKTLSADDSVSIEVISWISRMLYVILPGVFTWLMMRAGMDVGTYVGDAIGGMSKGPAGAAASGANTVASVAKTVITRSPSKK